MSDKPDAASGRARSVALLVVGLCWVAVGLDGFDLVVFGTVVPALLEYEQWALTPAEVGAIGSFGYVGMMIGALTVGVATDAIGRRKTVLLCVAWFSQRCS